MIVAICVVVVGVGGAIIIIELEEAHEGVGDAVSRVVFESGCGISFFFGFNLV